ncbi:hypothetical protein CUJ84_Chr000924 [Rhizobium leguminosarum]|uniref:Uncharacterized protein n=1 Tax=Rhizobium leguminosarum TaxID=384 RepID=A0A2K9YZB4_RHILE|nr:hypothetical protein CUJ84_Chr000924 [Rhizobium leguminosarum]
MAVGGEGVAEDVARDDYTLHYGDDSKIDRNRAAP